MVYFVISFYGYGALDREGDVKYTEGMKTATAFWNVFYGLFFLALVFFGITWLVDAGRLATFIPLGDFFLMALAIFRLTRLVCYDVILAFLRDWLAEQKEGTFFGTMSTLVHCPWCVGLWFSFFIVFFYFATPFAWPIILVLALAALATTLQLIANLLGWSAEYKKRVVIGPEGGKSSSTCG